MVKASTSSTSSVTSTMSAQQQQELSESGSGSTSATATTWGDEMDYLDDDEENSEQALPPIEVIGPDKQGIKLVIEYRLNDDGKKVKIVRKFQQKRVKLKATHAEIERRAWPRFGDAAGAKPGPDPATTVTADEVFLKLTTNAQELDSQEVVDPAKKPGASQKTVTCRVCKGDHFTLKCPYKDVMGSMEDQTESSKDDAVIPAAPGKYVPPSKRGGAPSKEGSFGQKSSEDTFAVRVSNLSEDTREADVTDLFRPFGQLSKVFIPKDRHTNASRGYAFVHFFKREDAAKAIEKLNGHGYDHLILSVEWSK